MPQFGSHMRLRLWPTLNLPIYIAAAGILTAHVDCLEYPGEQFCEVHEKSTNLIDQVSLMNILGHGCEYDWGSVHGPGCWLADGEVSLCVISLRPLHFDGNTLGKQGEV